MLRTFPLIVLGATLVISAVSIAGNDGAAPDSGPRRQASVARADCDRLADYWQTEAAAFVPGRDVRGDGVVPASGPGGAVASDSLVLDVVYEQPTGYGLSLRDHVATVTVRAGHGYVDGHPLNGDENRKLAADCRAAFGARSIDVAGNAG